MNFTRVLLMVTITAATVYVGLNLLLPPKHSTAVAEEGTSAAQVFGHGEQPAAEAAAPAASEPSAPAETAAPAAEAAAPSGSTLSEQEAQQIASAATSEAPAPAAEPAPAPAPEPAPAPAPEPVAAAPAPAPAPAPVHAAAASEAPKAASSAPAKMLKKLPPADALRAWWNASQASTGVKLLFAGQASGAKSIALVFSSDVDPAAAAASIKVTDKRGKAPAGAWKSGNNARVMVLDVGQNGRYTVVIKPELADKAGKALGVGLHGPVYVQ